MVGTVDHVNNFTQPCTLETGVQFAMLSECSGNSLNDISINYADNGIEFGDFKGAVECSSQGGGNTARSMTGTTQDSDGDGIPDSSDNCTHNSNPRCYKEEGTR